MLTCDAALTGILAVLAAFGQSGQPQANSATKDQPAQSQPAQPSPALPSPVPRSRSPYVSAQRNKHAENLYKTVWGIEELEVREAASGDLLRFSYRVADATRAQMLNDKKATPYLVDEKTGAVLQVPTMPKVGLLRQTADPENGKGYWMVFSNKGVVKPGSRVDVVVGNFRAIGLIVH